VSPQPTTQTRESTNNKDNRDRRMFAPNGEKLYVLAERNPDIPKTSPLTERQNR